MSGAAEEGQKKNRVADMMLCGHFFCTFLAMLYNSAEFFLWNLAALKLALEELK